jgi:hypothetical protein
MKNKYMNTPIDDSARLPHLLRRFAMTISREGEAYAEKAHKKNGDPL